jgi:hypothetical protein
MTVAIKRHGRKGRKGPIAKVRKPVAPPMRVEESVTAYKRARERERLRREQP